ncbi:MAG: hypothetical protein P8K66_09445 [Planctomycetota bacterium]|nr:hypothetical protein [Planctomycetota bacterium]
MNDSPEMPSADPTPLPRVHKKSTQTLQRSIRTRRIILFVVLPVMLVGVFFWVAERVLSPEQLYLRTTSLLEERISTGFSVAKVQWEWPSSVLVEDLVIHSPEGSRFAELLRIGLLDVDLSILGLLTGNFVISRVEVNKSTVVLERNNRGDLTLLNVVRESTSPVQGPLTEEESILTSEKKAIEPPEFVIRNLEVQTCPETVAHSPGGLDVSQLRLEISSEDPDLWEMDGLAFDSSVKSIRLDGGGRLSLGDFELVLEVDQLSLDEELRQRIPPALRLVWDRYNPSGIASLKHELFFRDSREVKNAMTVNLSQGELELKDPRINLTELAGELIITPSSISFRNPLTGKILGAEAQLEGAIQLETLKPGSSELRAKLSGLTFEPRIYEILVPEGQKIWDTYNPSGAFDFEMSFTGDEFPPQVSEVQLSLKNVDGNYAPYPYPLRDINGEVRYTPGLIEIDLAGGLSETPVRARGSFEMVRFGECHLLIEGQNIPIDDRVRTALGDKFSRTYDVYSPQGFADLSIVMERSKLGEPLDLKVMVEPNKASLEHKAFPYRINDVMGEITFDISGKKMLLRDLKGRNGESLVSLPSGYVDFETGAVEVPIESARLIPEKELLEALPTDVGNRLRSLDILNSGGSLDTVVELHKEPNQKLEIYVRARIADPLQLKYESLPYPLVFHSGQVVFSSSEKRVRLDELSTNPEASPIIIVSGELGPDDTLGEEDLNATLLAMKITVDPGPDGRGMSLSEPVFVDSLPDDPRDFFQQMNLAGLVQGTLDILHRFKKNDLEEFEETVRYDARGRIDQGGIDFGIKSDDLQALFEVHGGIKPGSGHTFSGQLRKCSLNFNKFLATVPEERTLDFSYGKVHPRLTPTGSSKFDIPSDWVLDRLPSDTSRLFQAEIGPAGIYGGTLDGFFFVDLNEVGGNYAGEVLVKDLQLSEGSMRLFSKPDIAGETQISTRFTGQVGKRGSTVGDGFFAINSGNLARIPLIAGALINPLEGLNRSNNKISSARGAFTIHDSIFEFKGMGSLVLESPSGEIFGKGNFGFDKSIDLIFEPQTLGGTPLISDIANRLLRFRVVGTIDEPEITIRKVKKEDL